MEISAKLDIFYRQGILRDLAARMMDEVDGPFL
jgi:hypothetical protein